MCILCASNRSSSAKNPKAYTSLGQNTKPEKPGQSILNLLDVGDDPAGRAVLRSRLLKFFGMLPLLSVHHASLLMQAVDAFFGARLYCSNLSMKDSKGNKSCAIGAVRLVCHFLRKAKDFLSSQNCDVADLQLHVVRHVAAAYLSAPCTQAKGLADQWEQQFWPQPMVAHVSIGLAKMPISYDMQHGPYCGIGLLQLLQSPQFYYSKRSIMLVRFL